MPRVRTFFASFLPDVVSETLVHFEWYLNIIHVYVVHGLPVTDILAFTGHFGPSRPFVYLLVVGDEQLLLLPPYGARRPHLQFDKRC